MIFLSQNFYDFIHYCSTARTYNFPLDDVTFDSLSKKNFSEETVKKIRWVRKMYWDWRCVRNCEHGNDEVIKCDLENFHTINVEDLAFGLRRFVTEVRKLDGTDFPAKTLYQIVLCVQFHLETKGIIWRLLDDDCFSDLKFTLDNVMKQRTSAGIGISVRKADVISKTDEDILWSRGVLGTDDPEQLLNTVVYIVGLHCAWRAGKEHRFLRLMIMDSLTCAIGKT